MNKIEAIARATGFSEKYVGAAIEEVQARKAKATLYADWRVIEAAANMWDITMGPEEQTESKPRIQYTITVGPGTDEDGNREILDCKEAPLAKRGVHGDEDAGVLVATLFAENKDEAIEVGRSAYRMWLRELGK